MIFSGGNNTFLCQHVIWYHELIHVQPILYRMSLIISPGDVKEINIQTFVLHLLGYNFSFVSSCQEYLGSLLSGLF